MCVDLWNTIIIAPMCGYSSSGHTGQIWEEGLFVHLDSSVFYNPLLDGYKVITLD